jgi:hypothetical protein
MSIATLGKASESTKQIFISKDTYDNQKVEDSPGSGVYYAKSNQNLNPGKKVRPG